MNKDIELSSLPSHQLDVEKGRILLTPTNKYVKRKLLALMTFEIMISLYLYMNYDSFLQLNPLLAPSLLGALTAALAQTFNQFVKNTYALNKIVKFIVWGVINGCFTEMWINIVMSIDNFFLRILVDQSIGGPGFQLIFSVLNSLWDSGTLNRGTFNAFFKSLKYSYCYWPFVSVLLFGFLPKDTIFPCNCAAALVWNVILSRLA